MANAVRGKGSGSTDKDKIVSTSGTKGSGGSSGSSGGSTPQGGVVNGSYAHAGNGYLSQKYTGGNAQLDAALQTWSDRYFAARAAGDAVGMRNANDEANKLRNQYGYAAEFASEDIAKIANQNKNTAGGAYAGGSGGSFPGSNFQLSQPEDLSNYLEEMYEAQRRAALAQINSAYQQNVSAIDRAGQGVGSQYQNARNQAAGASELSARNFNEYAAAAGLNSGAGGQAELARNVALQNNINDLNAQEAQTYADLELQRANAETQYNSAIAQAQADGDAALAQALYQEKVRVQQELLDRQIQQYQIDLQNYQLNYQAQQDAIANQQWQQQFDFNAGQAGIANEQWQQQFDYNAAEAERNRQWELGNRAISQGIIPSADMLVAMGMTPEYAQSWINYLRSLSAQGSGSGGGSSRGRSGSGGSSGGGSMTFTTAKQAASAGNFEDAVIATLKKNGFTDGMLMDVYGYDPYQSDFKKATGSYRYSGTGSLFTQSEYNRFVNEVMGNRTATGQLQTIKDARQEGKITDEQANSLINRFGLG